MAITYPRSDIIDPFVFATQSFTLPPRQNVSTGADGTTWGKGIGPELWLAQYTSIDLDDDAALALEAKLNSLRGVLNTFEAADGRRPYPKAHMDGMFGDTGLINTLNASTRAMSLKALDAGFVLSEGDYLAFTWASGRRALHQVLETVTADGSGVTAEFEVCPNIRPGAATGAAVTLKKPCGLFCLVPGTVSPQSQGDGTTISFRATQFA